MYVTDPSGNVIYITESPKLVVNFPMTKTIQKYSVLGH